MASLARIWGTVCLAAIALSGCDLKSLLLFSPEDKINAAFPISETVHAGKTALTAALPESAHGQFEAQYEARLRLRALGCAKDYAPSFFASLDDIRQKLGSPSCFIAADNELASWIGFRRIGAILAHGDLVPAPTQAPEFVVASGSIANASFARSAGMVLLDTPKAAEIIGLNNSKQIISYPRTSTIGGWLSPNGRLFTVSEGNSVEVREVVSGNLIGKLPVRANYDLQWLDARTAFYLDQEGGNTKPVLIDFTSGKKIALPMVSASVRRAVPAPDADNQYILISDQSASRIELVRGGMEPEAKLMAEKQVRTDGSWTLNRAALTSDGKTLTAAQGARLTLLSLGSLDTESISLAPFNAYSAQPTTDPDSIVLGGFHAGGQKQFVYSITQKTLSEIDGGTMQSARILVVPSLNKLGMIKDTKITLVDKLPTQPAVPMAQFIAAALELANQQKLEAFEQQQRALSSHPQAGTPPTTTYPAQGTGQIASLAQNARIEGVGVYQGVRRPGAREASNISVRVRRSSRPIILVLSSYEPVRWNISYEPGAQVSAVLLSGYHASQVNGAGAARVISSGGAYAYKQGSSEYNELNRNTMRWTGKGIDLFQGRYEGASFEVGG
ncbi:MAG: hypothetical protein REI94_01475 [Moraxellaceae bacterium]|nr:hypothetical protein [Moraxellaceae bacterium]